MNAINSGIISEAVGVVGAAVPQDCETPVREQAADRLAQEMDTAARAFHRMAERIGLVLEAERTLRRTAWNATGHSRGGRMRLAAG